MYHGGVSVMVYSIPFTSVVLLSVSEHTESLFVLIFFSMLVTISTLILLAALLFASMINENNL